MHAASNDHGVCLQLKECEQLKLSNPHVRRARNQVEFLQGQFLEKAAYILRRAQLWNGLALHAPDWKTYARVRLVAEVRGLSKLDHPHAYTLQGGTTLSICLILMCARWLLD